MMNVTPQCQYKLVLSCCLSVARTAVLLLVLCLKHLHSWKSHSYPHKEYQPDDAKTQTGGECSVNRCRASLLTKCVSGGFTVIRITDHSHRMMKTDSEHLITSKRDNLTQFPPKATSVLSFLSNTEALEMSVEHNSPNTVIIWTWTLVLSASV